MESVEQTPLADLWLDDPHANQPECEAGEDRQGRSTIAVAFRRGVSAAERRSAGADAHSRRFLLQADLFQAVHSPEETTREYLGGGLTQLGDYGTATALFSR
jgi:hypothetical protein